MEKKIFVSFRCYFPTGDPCNKTQDIKLSDIPRWIESYLFTHPLCTAVTVKVWSHDVFE